MKSALATSLSIAGVLAAGGVAMGLNTAVLTSKTGRSDLVQQVLEQVSPSTTLPGAEGVVGAAASDPSSESTTFSIGAAGTIAVSVTGATLEVTDITVGSGWTASPPRYADSSHVKVHFTSTAQMLEVRITLVDGVPQVTVEDDSGAPAPGFPADGDRDGDHDDDHDGEHEHEHEEEHGEEADDD